MSTTTTWSEANDQKLWSLRYKPISQLASTFDKTQGAIRSRIKHLNDPNHKAYRRRVKNGIAPLPSTSTAARKQSAINMMASPFATGYLAASEALSSQKRSSSTNSNNVSNKKSKVQNSSINGGGGVIDLCDSDDEPLSSLASLSSLAKKKSSVSTSSSFSSTAAKRTSNTNTIGASSFAANYLAAKLSSSSSNSTSSSNARTKSTNNGRIDPSTLNTDQQSASKYIFSGGNAFLTG